MVGVFAFVSSSVLCGAAAAAAEQSVVAGNKSDRQGGREASERTNEARGGIG